MSPRSAFKRALVAYATRNKIKIPAGLNFEDTYGSSARSLCAQIQKRHKIKANGDITPKTLLIIGKDLPGGLTDRAVFCMRLVEGPLEVWGINDGPFVREIQKLGSELGSGTWPWCAASVSWALRCAGWSSWAAFVKNRSEAYVPDWVSAAQQNRYGLSVVPWYSSRSGDLITYQFDSDKEQDHIGFVLSRPSIVTGECRAIEGNTSSGSVGSQADGSGLWTRSRNAKPPQIILRVQ